MTEQARPDIVDFSEYKAYYESEHFKPLLPEHSHWRHWRFHCADGTWRKVQRTIKTVEDLRRAVLRYRATDVYYGTATWLANQQNKGSNFLTGKKGASYKYADRLLYNQQFFLDFDAKTPEGMEEALAEARWVISRIAKKPVAVVFTGCKGFSIEYDFPLTLPISPVKRLRTVEKVRKQFLTRLQQEHPLPHLDTDTTTDVMRVRRCSGTINSKTGRVSRLLTPDEMGVTNGCSRNISQHERPVTSESLNKQEPEKENMITAQQIILHTPRIITNEKGLFPKPSRGLRTDGSNPRAMETTPNDQLPTARTNADDASREPTSALFITSKDLSTRNRHVVFLCYQTEQVKEIKKLCEVYKLGAIVTLRDNEDNYWYCTTKTFTPERAEKVYRASHASNKNTFLKFHRAYLPWNVRPTGLINRWAVEAKPRSEQHNNHYNKLFGLLLDQTPLPRLEISRVTYKGGGA